jgi:hypothetical protein
MAGPIPSVTTSLVVTVRTRPPPSPATVTVYVPVGVIVDVLEAERVRVELVPVVEVGLNDAFAPAGSPLTVNATALVTLDLTIPTDAEALEPCLTVTLEREIDKRKPGSYVARVRSVPLNRSRSTQPAMPGTDPQFEYCQNVQP